MMGDLLPLLIYGMIIAMFLGMIYDFIKPMLGLVPNKRQYVSRDAGDRLRKYLINASKLNPKKAKYLKIRRTGLNEGGKIGKIKGLIPSRYCTRFIVKAGLFSKKIIYCPVDMHSSVHSREIVIHAMGLENASGFYYPIPYDGTQKKGVFDLFQKAFNIDMLTMQELDLHQINPTQIEKAIAGERVIERRTRRPPEEPEYEEVESS